MAFAAIEVENSQLKFVHQKRLQLEDVTSQRASLVGDGVRRDRIVDDGKAGIDLKFYFTGRGALTITIGSTNRHYSYNHIS